MKKETIQREYENLEGGESPQEVTTRNMTKEKEEKDIEEKYKGRMTRRIMKELEEITKYI